MPTQNTTRTLAGYLAQVRYDDLTTQALEDTRRSVLDWLGSALGGSVEPQARMARAVVQGLGVSEQATVLGGGRSSAAGAALVNGLATHILELDDVHKGSTIHAAAPIIPAALAVAEREGANDQDFLLAVALGYEAAFRIGEAVNPSHYRYWHPTGTVATFGAAVAAGSLLGLNAAQMLDALGSAGTQASGLWEFNADGTMSKTLHPGKAAFNGILAADLAKQGFTGASKILEGERGFFKATTQHYDASKVTEGLGEVWKISENCYKLYSCCGHTHSAIDAALDLREQMGWKNAEALNQIGEIHIQTYGPGYEIVKEMNPRTPYQGKFSLAYVVCAALLEGSIGLPQFSLERFDESGVVESNIAALLQRVRISVEPDLTQRYPAAWPNYLELALKDGRRVKAGSDYPRGNPENPVSTKGLEDKYRRLVEPRLGETISEQGLALVSRLGEGMSASEFRRAWAAFADFGVQV